MASAANPSPGAQQNPSHRITIEPFDGIVTVAFSDATLASTEKALVLREADYRPAYYIPFDDIDFELLKRSDTSTHCPYKGDASYWNASAAGDVMWSYESPYDEMTVIKGHGAFYPDKVTIEATPFSPDL